MNCGRFSKSCQKRYSSSGARLIAIALASRDVPPLVAPVVSRCNWRAHITSRAVTATTPAVAAITCVLLVAGRDAAPASVSRSSASPATRDHTPVAGLRGRARMSAPAAISRTPYSLTSERLRAGTPAMRSRR